MQLADQEANWCFIDSIHFVFISFFPEYKIHTTQIVFLIKLHRPFYTTAYKSTIIMSKLKQFSFVFNSFFFALKEYATRALLWCAFWTTSAAATTMENNRLIVIRVKFNYKARTQSNLAYFSHTKSNFHLLILNFI